MQPIGICLASRSGLAPTRVAELARDAEQAGCGAFFVAERAADALALCQLALAATSRISVGTAVANAPARHPALTAMTAAAMAEAYGDRFMLGLGMANPDLNQRVLGLPAAPPLTFMREYVAVVRTVLAGAGEPFAGAVFNVGPLPPDRPAPGGSASVPVLLAALLPRMLQLAGEVADGVILNLTALPRLPAVLENVARGARRAGRSPSAVQVACVLPCCLSDDATAARQAARGVVAGYARHPAVRRLFQDTGFGPDPTDDMVDALVLHGDERACRERIDAYRAAGVDLPIVFPMPTGEGWDAAFDRAVQLCAQASERKDTPCQVSPLPAA